MAALLEARDLTVGYERDIDILQGVSVRVEEGALTGMIGLNGAGKTTLTKTIYGFLVPRHGAVYLRGEDITGVKPHELIRRGVWYLPQDSSLFPFLSVEDNLRLPLRHLDVSREQGERRLERTFESFPDLARWRRKKAGDLSGGQRTMLECAKAGIVEPEILIVDEPSVGLAPKVALQVYEQITAFLREGTTIFLIDHNVRKVIELADYVYVLNIGRIASEGPREAFEGELKEQVQRWLGL